MTMHAVDAFAVASRANNNVIMDVKPAARTTFFEILKLTALRRKSEIAWIELFLLNDLPSTPTNGCSCP